MSGKASDLMDHEYIEQQDLVRRYAIGRLPVEECERFEAHYLTCGDCQDRLEEFEAMRAGLTEWAVDRAPAAVRRKHGVARLVLAAVLACLLVVPVSLLMRETPTDANGVAVLPVSQLRGANDSPQASIETGGGFVLMIELDWPEHSAYQVQIRDADGEVAWAGDGLRPNYLDSLAINIPPGFLAPGTYRAEVRSSAGDNDTFVGTFPFELHNNNPDPR